MVLLPDAIDMLLEKVDDDESENENADVSNPLSFVEVSLMEFFRYERN